jgi:signal transduction histidine kinase/tetratricopeptide (TPR) repeat protein
MMGFVIGFVGQANRIITGLFMSSLRVSLQRTNPLKSINAAFISHAFSRYDNITDRKELGYFVSDISSNKLKFIYKIALKMPLRLVLTILVLLTSTLLQGQSIDKLLLDYNNATDSVQRLELEQKLAWAYQDQQIYQRAIEFFQRALQRKTGDTLQAQQLRASIAICYGELRDTKAEINVREEMLRYGHDDKRYHITNLQSLSGLYVIIKNYPKAIDCNEMLLKEALQTNDYNLIANTYNNLGYIFHVQDDSQKSSEYFNKSYVLATAPGTDIKDEDRAKIITNLGVTKATLGDLDEAQKYFEEALSVSRRQKNPVQVAKALNYKATGQYLKGETSLAVNTLEEGVAMLEKLPISEEADAVRSDCYKLMSELMLRKKNISQFKVYQKKYDAIQDQSLQREKIRNRLLVERQLEIEKQERDIQRLIAENQRNRVQIVESELVTLQKERELKEKKQELEVLKNENELQAARFKNQALEKERISQLLEISQQKSRDVEQKQRIDLLERDKTVKELSLAKSKKEIEFLESSQQQQTKIKEYSFAIIGLLLLLLVIAVQLYFYRAKKNKKLGEQNYKINEMNQEMLAQNEELTSMNEILNERTDQVEEQNKRLTEAQIIINEQNDKLLSYNKNLEIEIEKRTKEIKITNKELLHYNNQLEQFAFTVSHNLRGPIARLLGLTNLIRMSPGSDDLNFLLTKIDQNSRDIDDIIRDLTKILNVKNNERLTESIDLTERVDKAIFRLETAINESNAIITSDFSEVNTLASVSSCIDSIFYNLISNGIKYRSRERACYIEVKSAQKQGFVELYVKDNGMGIDLEKYGHQLFGLYKRFTTHITDGRGLGLYLVKAEVESLHGTIEVESVLDQGTTFKIMLPCSSAEIQQKRIDEKVI